MNKEKELLGEFGGLILNALHDYKKWFDEDHEEHKSICYAIEKLEALE